MHGLGLQMDRSVSTMACGRMQGRDLEPEGSHMPGQGRLQVLRPGWAQAFGFQCCDGGSSQLVDKHVEDPAEAYGCAAETLAHAAAAVAKGLEGASGGKRIHLSARDDAELGKLFKLNTVLSKVSRAKQRAYKIAIGQTARRRKDDYGAAEHAVVWQSHPQPEISCNAAMLAGYVYRSACVLNRKVDADGGEVRHGGGGLLCRYRRRTWQTAPRRPRSRSATMTNEWPTNAPCVAGMNRRYVVERADDGLFLEVVEEVLRLVRGPEPWRGWRQNCRQAGRVVKRPTEGAIAEQAKDKDLAKAESKAAMKEAAQVACRTCP